MLRVSESVAGLRRLTVAFTVLVWLAVWAALASEARAEERNILNMPGAQRYVSAIAERTCNRNSNCVGWGGKCWRPGGSWYRITCGIELTIERNDDQFFGTCEQRWRFYAKPHGGFSTTRGPRHCWREVGPEVRGPRESEEEGSEGEQAPARRPAEPKEESSPEGSEGEPGAP